MESSLKCNVCRVELKDQALVTSCLHIFCLGCTNNHNFSQCPLCQAALPSVDHATIANLRPSDDYKSSILRGLSPAAAIECAKAALGFWEYQMAQEIVFQDYMQQNMKARWFQTQAELDKLTGEANGSIRRLSDKLSEATLERDLARRKNDELAGLLQEKSKRLLQVQELYDKLKRKAMLGSLQEAANEAVDSTLVRVVAAGATPMADRTQRPGLYQQQAEQGYSGLGRSDGGIPGGLQNREHWESQFRRSHISANPSRVPSNDAAGIGLANVPGLVVGGAPMLNQERRHDLGARPSNPTSHLNHLSHLGASQGFGFNASKDVGGLGGGGIHMSAQKPQSQRPGASILAPPPREGPQWRPN